MTSVTYGKQTITYSLNRADRKTLAITVKPDMSVVVTAPHSAEQEAIERIIRKRSAWIARQQRFFAQFLPRTPARQFVSGETHLYLGRQYRLRLRQSESEEVKLIGGYLYIYVGDTSNADKVRELLCQWYAAHAEVRFNERLTACMQQIAGWNIPTPQLEIRSMVRSWGSCSPSGRLTLNIDIVRAPRACIDYVILHEICHLVHPNHSREFYKLLGAVVPDWRNRKLRLEKMLS
jgi:predicted metal-dependent hydrolase